LIIIGRADDVNILSWKWEARPLREVILAWKGRNIPMVTTYKMCKRLNAEGKVWFEVVRILVAERKTIQCIKEAKVVKENEAKEYEAKEYSERTI
jgi:hypothetical protein